MLKIKDDIDLKELMHRLSQLTYYSKNSGYKFNVIAEENLPLIENVIREFLLDNYYEEIGKLEAKVYTYEKIIANSNFSPLLNNKEIDLVEKVSDK